MVDRIVGFLLSFSGPTAYATVFGVLLLCGFGVPIPEDITLIGGGLLAYYGRADVYAMIVVGMAGVMIGDSVIFMLGAKYGTDLVKKKGFRRVLSAQKLAIVEEKLKSHGNKLIFSARFMPGLRTPIFFSCGSLGVPFKIFFFFDGLAAILSVPLIVYGTYYFGDQLDRVVEIVRSAEYGILGVIAVAAIVYYVRYRIRKKKLQAQTPAT